MSEVRAIDGQLRPEELGVTLVHEHILVGFQGWDLDPDARYDVATVAERAAQALQPAADAGVQTFVDATPLDLGRNVALLAEVARRSPVRIIFATGFYTELRGEPTYWREFLSDSQIAAFLQDEITRGVGGDGPRPGVIKAAVATFGKAEQKFLRAVAMAAAATDTPVICHTDSRFGVEAAQLLLAGGVAPTRILISHCDTEEREPTYYDDLVRLGIFLGFDRIGNEFYMPDERRVVIMRRLLDAGHERQMLVSHDQYVWSAGSQKTGAPIPQNASGGRRLPPGMFTYVTERFLPERLGIGKGDALFDVLLRQNPAIYLGGQS